MKLSLPLILTFLLLTGCLFPNGPASRNTRYSADYTDFAPVDDSTMIYWNQARRVRDYKKFFVTPVEFYANPQVKVPPYNRGIFSAQADKYREKLIEGLKSSYYIVGAPGPGVLKIKVEVVDIKPNVWLTNQNGTRYFRKDTALKGTKFDVSCLDAVSGETIFALVTLFGGEKYMAYEEPALLPNVDDAFNQWVKFLRLMLEKSRK